MKTYTKEEEKFVRRYGSINCKRLRFKDADIIMHEMEAANASEIFDDKLIAYIEKMAGEEVLVQVCSAHGSPDDFFTCGENDTPFTRDCFEVEEAE